jgi:hypothetical protein
MIEILVKDPERFDVRPMTSPGKFEYDNTKIKNNLGLAQVAAVESAQHNRQQLGRRDRHPRSHRNASAAGCPLASRLSR